ncbi:hypothetical protein DLREEDagrD3_11050 [Denitratisoma sp. agr-D3]
MRRFTFSRQTLPWLVVLALAGCGTTGSKPADDRAATTASTSTVNATTTSSPTSRRPGSARKPLSEEPSVQNQVAADLTVYFPTGVVQLSPEALDGLRGIADQLRADRQQDAQLTARARFVGSRSLCLALATQRLNAVAEKLVQLGARGDQLRQQNMSCDNPKVAQVACPSRTCNDPEERVEVRLLR